MSADLSRLASALSTSYRIEREVGAGGMATVYLAQDLRHDRRVAVKVLRPELAAVIGAERFLAEIKTTANLQHSHILPLFDSGAADSFLFYVMPFIDGETLRDRLTREKQLPIADAVRIAREVASALDYAHRHGVIHRDIKPENILLHDGSALVADFGIALAASKAGGTRMTETGMSLGTPQYMSPEQAMGERDLDARTDVYGLGCVLYEMLAGEPPFTGPTAQAIVAKVMTEKPVSILNRRDTVPPGVEHAVSIALQKIPADRWSTAAAFSDALDGRGSGPTGAPAASAPASRTGSRGGRNAAALPWAAFGVAAIAAIWGWRHHAAPDAHQVVRFAAQLPPGAHLAFPILGTGTTIAISPDGRRVAYSATIAGANQLYLQSVDELRPRALAGSAGAFFPEFSPDGKWLAFVSADQMVKKVAVDGGSITTLCAVGSSSGLTWISNETLVFSKRMLTESRGLWRVSADGGEPVLLSPADTARGETLQLTPRSAGDGRLVFYSSVTGNLSNSHIGVISLETGKATVLKNLLGSSPLGMANGRLLFVRNDGALMAASFDTRTLRAGAPVQVADSIAISHGYTAAAISASGTLVYVHGSGMNQLVMTDDRGQATALVDQKRPYSHPRFSPDGRRIAFDVLRTQGTDIWVYDLAARTFQRLTTEATNDRPEWTPDGRKLLYSSDRTDGKYSLWWQLADGSAPAELLYASSNNIREGVVAPDGRAVIYREDTPRNNRDVFLLPLTGERIPVPLLATPSDELMPRVSPNGKWLAYVSDESGQYEVYVRPLAAAAGRIPVSNGGGIAPLWSPDGKTIYYGNGTKMVAASVATTPSLAVTGRRVLFDAPFDADPFHPNYDVAHDGKGFVMLTSADDDRQLVVVQNWAHELQARTARKR